MARKSKAFLKRSAAAKRGHETRRRHERAELRKHNKQLKARRDKARTKREILAEKRPTWRLTILLPYGIRPKRSRTRKKKKTSESPQYTALRLTAWFPSKKDANARRASMFLRAEKTLLDLMKSNKNIFRSDKAGSDIDSTLEEIPFSPSLHGKVEIEDESEGEIGEDE